MSEEKAIRVVVGSVKNSDYDGWSGKHLAKAEYKGYCKVGSCEKDQEGFNKVPTEKPIEDIEANASIEEADEKILKLDKPNKQTSMDLVLSINTTTSNVRTAFQLMEKCKMSKYPKENSKIAWEQYPR